MHTRSYVARAPDHEFETTFSVYVLRVVTAKGRHSKATGSLQALFAFPIV
jgi:hypothetical protein